MKGAPLSKADIAAEGTPFILYGELYTTYSEVAYEIQRKTDKEVEPQFYSRIGDVIMPTSGETPEDIATATCVMTPNVILAGDLLIYRTTAVDGRIISYAIKNKVNKQIASVAQGKSVVHVRAEELGKVIINYPTKAEQEKIITMLALLEQRLVLQKRIIETLKKYKRGLLSTIFSKVTTFVHLKDICEYASSAKTMSQIDNTPKGAYPVYDAGGVAAFVDFYDMDTNYIAIIKDGSGVGRLQFCQAESSFIGTLGGLIPKNCSAFYLYTALQTIDFKEYVTGMAIPHIYYKDYKYAMLPYPCEKDRAKIQVIFQNLDCKITNAEMLLEKFNEMKKSLLQQLFI